MSQLNTWLLQGPAWMQFCLRRDMLGKGENSPEVGIARIVMLRDPQVQALICDLSSWPGAPITNHKSAGLLLHKLVFLADLGLQAPDPGLEGIVSTIMRQPSSVGPFQVLVNIPRHFGGSGLDEWAWLLCDTPLLLYALAKMGLQNDPVVRKAATFLAGLVRPNGWPCATSPEAGSFRGPGRKSDPCPYANLLMLKALAQFPDFVDSRPVRIGTQTALDLWQKRRDEHPYLFNMGTDFCKLKAPMVWYDILHVVDVLSLFPWLHGDPRLLEMAAVITSKTDAEGRYTPESIWTAWKDWEFGQKRQPSYWLTFLVERIKQRFNHDEKN